MKNEEKQIGQAAGGKIGTGIRLKLFSFLLPLVFLLIALVTWVVTEVTESALRRDLLQRGAAISRGVALSAGHSLLAHAPRGLERLVSETRSSDPDIAFVAVRDASDIVVAHDRVSERGKAYRHVPPLLPLGTFGDTHADEVVRDGRRYIEYTTPISFAGRRVGIASLGLSMEGLPAPPAPPPPPLPAAGGRPPAGQAALPRGSLPRERRDVPARSGALLRRTGRSHPELQPDGGDDPRPEDRPAEESASTGGIVHQHGPRHRRVAGRQGPVYDGPLHPRGADGVRAGTAPRDGGGGVDAPGAGGDLPRSREDPDPGRTAPQGGTPDAGGRGADEKPFGRRHGDPPDGAVPPPVHPCGARPSRVV